MGVVQLEVRGTKTRAPVYADVERYIRHRGIRSLVNYFIIGKATISNPTTLYRISLCPFAYFDAWWFQKQREMELDGMVKWADGMVTPHKMIFMSCTDESEISQVLAYAFSNFAADEHLDDFYAAEVHLPFLKQTKRAITIASLLKA